MSLFLGVMAQFFIWIMAVVNDYEFAKKLRSTQQSKF